MINQLAQFFGQDATRTQAYQNFGQQYQQDPSQLSGTAVAQHYGDLARHMDSNQMEAAHQQAFGQMSEADRMALAQHYQQVTNDPNQPYQGYPQGMPLQQAAQPQQLGRMTQQAAQSDPNMLGQLLGPNSPLNSTGAKLAMAGAAAALASSFLSNR
ncbi:MAG: hypothetical protein NVSMB42_22210 [Herpetosiphon sp.]